MIRLVFLISIITAFSIPNRYQRYIDEHLTTAKGLQVITGVPVSVQFAQAIYESGAGRSNIAQKANNHFGIRCGDGWEGLEYYSKSGCWRKYESIEAGYLDHACFLQHYYPNSCFKDYTAWEGLEGYGESKYWTKINRIIKRYKLYKYD